MRTANPALNANIFHKARSFGVGDSMTIQGTVNKTFLLLFMLLIPAVWVWKQVIEPVGIFEQGSTGVLPAMVMPAMMTGAILGFIMAMVTIFKKEWAMVTAPIYAVCEGLFIGGISAIFEVQYPGIVIQAVTLTFGTLFCLLLAYKSGLIKVTENFRMGVVAATGAIALIYFISFIMSFFGASIPLIHSSGTFGIIFSLVVVCIAAMNLVLDFIE